MGRLHDVGQSFKAFLSATATGILLFLLLGRAQRGGRAGRGGAERARLGPIQRLAALAFGGFAVGLLSLVYYDSWMKARRRKALPRPGRRLGDRARALALRGAHARRSWLALFIATGIGLHNFSEGPRDRAVGGARRDQPRLRARDRLRAAQRDRGLRDRRAAVRRRRAAELALPRPARRDRRRPDLLRHAGRPGVDERRRVSVLFLSLAAGSILYVVMELLNVCRLFSSEDDHGLGPAARADARVRDGLRARRGRRLVSARRVTLRHRLPARHHARARRARVHLRAAGRRRQGRGRLGAVRARAARAEWSSTRRCAAGGGRRAAGREGRATSCRRRSSTSRSGSPSTTARRRRARSSWSRRCGRPGARSRRRRASGSRSRARPTPERLSDDQVAAVARSSDALDAGGGHYLLYGADRQRQDRGLPPGRGGGARARARDDRARPGDRARAADRRPLPRALRRLGRDPALGADRRGAPRRARADRDAARRVSSSARARRSSRRCTASA